MIDVDDVFAEQGVSEALLARPRPPHHVEKVIEQLPVVCAVYPVVLQQHHAVARGQPLARPQGTWPPL